jgi:hypothetical protein
MIIVIPVTKSFGGYTSTHFVLQLHSAEKAFNETELQISIKDFLNKFAFLSLDTSYGLGTYIISFLLL